MLSDEGVEIGRFKVRRLMSELGLICKQPGPHAYKQATVERPDIPNRLNRELQRQRPTKCGAVTLPTSGPASDGVIWPWCWTFMLAALLAGRYPPARMPSWLSKHWIMPTSSAAGRGGSVPFGSGQPVRQPLVPSAALALPNGAKHEPPGKLLGQCPDGEPIPEPEM